MTKTFKALALVGVATLGFGATAANAATASADAKAKILSPIVVTKTADLDYATIVTGASPATVQVSTAGARTCGAGLVCTGTATAAGFSIVGTVGEVVTVSVPATVSLTSGPNNMSSTLVSSSAATMTLAATNAFTVGGTLSVAGNQPDGVYAGAFTVTVNYQ